MEISVLINNFNYGRFLKRAIDSVLSQIGSLSVEVIVFDDGSTDDSISILSDYGDEILVLSNHEKDPLSSNSFNQANAIYKAFLRSKGDFIFLLDSDDYFGPHKLEIVLEEFKRNRDVICVQHSFQLVDLEGNNIDRKKRPIISGVDLPWAINFTGRLDLFFSQTSSLAFRRLFLDEILPLEVDEFNLLWPDLRLTRNAIFKGEIVMIYENLGFYRIHGANDSDKLKDSNFLKEFMLQHKFFYNSIAERNGYSNFEYRNWFESYLRVLILLFHSKMSFRSKISFLRDLFNIWK